MFSISEPITNAQEAVKIVTPRKDSDTVQILSDTFEGQTLSTPISM